MTLDEAVGAVRRHKEGVLVDTNLLLLLLAGTVDRALIAKWKRTSTYDDDDFELLSDLLESHHGLVITPHVATEVSNLATSLSTQNHQQFFELFAGYLRQAKSFRSPRAKSLPLTYSHG